MNEKQKEKRMEESEITAMNGGTSNTAQDPELVEKVERVLKLFNASSLDDIIKVTPIASMRKIISKTRGNF